MPTRRGSPGRLLEHPADAAAERRASLDGWGVTTDHVGRVLEEAAR